MNKKITVGLLFVLIGILFSCGEIDSYYNQVLKKDSGLVRGVTLNDSKKKVKSQEKNSALIKEEGDYLLEYEYFLKEDDSYTISYSFDSEGCLEIAIATYFKEEDEAKSVLREFKNRFNEKYGTPQLEDNLYKWKNEDQTVGVELDYLTLKEGMVSLTIYAMDKE